MRAAAAAAASKLLCRRPRIDASRSPARCCRLTKELLEASGIPLQHAIATLRQCLPRHAILVGQNIAKDVQWLNLR